MDIALNAVLNLLNFKHAGIFFPSFLLALEETFKVTSWKLEKKGTGLKVRLSSNLLAKTERETVANVITQ